MLKEFDSIIQFCLHSKQDWELIDDNDHVKYLNNEK